MIPRSQQLPIDSIFDEGSSPTLLTICYLSYSAAKLPRVMHKHDDCLEILFVEQGSGSYFINGEKYHTKQGDILIYNSGALHDECHVSHDSSDEIRLYGCSISGLKIKGLPANHLVLPNQNVMISSSDYSDDIAMLFALLFRQVKVYGNYYKETVDHLLKALLRFIYELSKSNLKRAIPTNEILGRRIQDYLDKHYDETINLEKVAKHLNVNKFYLSHMFKTYSGYSPMQYLIRRRIGEAQTLLLNSQRSVTEIAHIVGYNSVSHFQQAFLGMVGMSPYKYRCFMLDKERDEYLLMNSMSL